MCLFLHSSDLSVKILKVLRQFDLNFWYKIPLSIVKIQSLRMSKKSFLSKVLLIDAQLAAEIHTEERLKIFQNLDKKISKGGKLFSFSWSEICVPR